MFDNVDDPSILDRYWPSCSHGSIILTTQSADLSHRTTSDVRLESFSSAEGSTLIQQMLKGKADSEQAEQLSNEIGGLPLLIVHLAGFMIQSRCLLSEVLGAFHSLRSDSGRILRSNSTISTTYQYLS